MIGYLDLLGRSTIGFLLTAVLKDGLRVLGEIMVAIPIAYFEAFEIILRPHTEEDIVMERVKPQRTPGLIFLDIFSIAFTPKTIVVKDREHGWYEVHRVRRRKNK